MPEVVIALDVPSREDALAVLELIPDARWVKVGSVLLTGSGPYLVDELVARGLRVFLDLKWHDIPNTVAGAVAAASSSGVAMATVHALGGPAMLRAAAQAAGSVALVGVTVLTSHSDREWAQIMACPGEPLEREVTRLATMAREAGIDGVVCSPQEIGSVKAVLGEGGLIVTPGIRRTGDRAADQLRVASPRAAAAAGATHLVVGRPILEAEDPRAAYLAIVEEARCDHSS